MDLDSIIESSLMKKEKESNLAPQVSEEVFSKISAKVKVKRTWYERLLIKLNSKSKLVIDFAALALSVLIVISIPVIIDKCKMYKGFSTSINNSNLNISSNEVQKINISYNLPLLNAFDITDEKKVQQVIDYFNSLNKTKTKSNPEPEGGGEYIIKLYLRNGSIREMWLSGNKYFIDGNGVTYAIPYEEAIKFDTIVANILEENEDKTSELSIAGKVISVTAENSGKDSSCVIKDENNKTYNINLEHAKIIDATGNGCLVLFKEDGVKVFYQKNDKTANGTIDAVTVYIKEEHSGSNQTSDDNQDAYIKNISLKTNDTDLLTISMQMMQKYLDQFKADTTEKDLMISDYKINKIRNLEGNNSDFKFCIDYALKPKDINSYILCGNGELDGEWITNKEAFVEIIKDNDCYKIKSIGTGP